MHFSNNPNTDKSRSSHQMELQHLDVEQGISLDDHTTDDNILPAITVSRQQKEDSSQVSDETSTISSGIRHGSHGKVHVTNSTPKSPISPTLPPIQSEPDLEGYENRQTSQPHVGNGETAKVFFQSGRNVASGHHLATLPESDQNGNNSADEQQPNGASVTNQSNLSQSNVANGNAGKIEGETKNGKANGDVKKTNTEDNKNDEDAKSNVSTSQR